MASLKTTPAARRRSPLVACALAGAVVGGLVVGDAVVGTGSAQAAPASTSMQRAFAKMDKHGVGLKGYAKGKKFGMSDLNSPKGALAELTNASPGLGIVTVDVANTIVSTNLGEVSEQQTRKNTIVNRRVATINTPIVIPQAQVRAPDGTTVVKDVLDVPAGDALEGIVDTATIGDVVSAQQRTRQRQVTFSNESGTTGSGTMRTRSDAQGRIVEWSFEAAGKNDSVIGPQLGMQLLHQGKPGANGMSTLLPPSSIKPKNLTSNVGYGKTVPGKNSPKDYYFKELFAPDKETGVVELELFTHEKNGWKSSGSYRLTNWDKAVVKAANKTVLRGTTMRSTLSDPYRLVSAVHNGVKLEAVLEKGANGKESVVWWTVAGSDNPFKK